MLLKIVRVLLICLEWKCLCSEISCVSSVVLIVLLRLCSIEISVEVELVWVLFRFFIVSIESVIMISGWLMLCMMMEGMIMLCFVLVFRCVFI